MTEQATSHRQRGQAHCSLADVLDALEPMGVNVIDEEIDYVGEAVVEGMVAEVRIAAELPGEISTPSDDQADPALVEQLQEDLDEAESRVEGIQQERDELLDRIDDLEAQIDEDEVERLKDELSSAREAQNDLEEQIAELQEERNEAIEEVQRLNQQLAEAPSADDVGELEAERDRLQERSEQLAETINVQAEKIAELQSGDTEEAAAEELVDEHEPDEEPDADLDRPERATLEAMRECGETTVAQLAEDCDVSNGTIHGRLHRLREHDLIEARPDPDDGRRKLYRAASADVPEESDDSENVQEDTDEEEAEVPEEDDPADEVDREQAVRDILEEDGPMRARELRERVAEELGRSESWAKEIPERMAESGDLANWADPDDGRMTHYGLPEQEPEDTDTEHEYAYPTDCGKCGAPLEGSVEESVHRTEEHGNPQVDLGYLEQGEFAAIVEDAESVNEIVGEVSFSFEKVLRLLGVYGLEDVVGGDVELSDVTDFEFGGVDEDASESEGSATGETPAPNREDTPTAANICMRHDLDRDEVVDAIADAQGIFHVRRDLGLPADVAETLLKEFGFLEELKGSGFVGRERAEEEVYKQVPRSVAADGGGRRV